MRRCLAALVILALLTAGCLTRTAPQSDDALRQQLAEILKKNPEIVLDVLRAHDKEVYEIVEHGLTVKREEDRARQLTEELAHPFNPVVEDGRPTRGEAGALVTVVAYSDFLCSYCAKAAKTVNELLAKHPGEIRYVFKNFGDDALAKLIFRLFAAIYMQDQDKAWRFHDTVFERQHEVRDDAENVVDTIIGELGIDRDRLAQDVTDPRIETWLAADAAEGQKFKLRGTPNFLVNGVSIRGSYPLEEFERVMSIVIQGTSAGAAAAGEGGNCTDCLNK